MQLLIEPNTRLLGRGRAAEGRGIAPPRVSWCMHWEAALLLFPYVPTTRSPYSTLFPHGTHRTEDCCDTAVLLPPGTARQTHQLLSRMPPAVAFVFIELSLLLGLTAAG